MSNEESWFVLMFLQHFHSICGSCTGSINEELYKIGGKCYFSRRRAGQ